MLQLMQTGAERRTGGVGCSLFVVIVVVGDLFCCFAFCCLVGFFTLLHSSESTG